MGDRQRAPPGRAARADPGGERVRRSAARRARERASAGGQPRSRRADHVRRSRHLAELTGWSASSSSAAPGSTASRPATRTTSTAARPNASSCTTRCRCPPGPATSARSRGATPRPRRGRAGGGSRPASARMSPTATAAYARTRRCDGWRRWSPASRRPTRSSHAVIEEVARLLGAQTGILVRFGPEAEHGDRHGRRGWAERAGLDLDIGRRAGGVRRPHVDRRGDPHRPHRARRRLHRRRGQPRRASARARPALVGRGPRDRRRPHVGRRSRSTTGAAVLSPDAEARIGEFAELVALCLSSAEARSELRRLARAHRGRGRRRAPAARAQPARRRPAAAGRRCRCTCAWPARPSPDLRAAGCSRGRGSELRRRWRSCASSPAASTRRCSPTSGLRAALETHSARAPVPVTVDVELDARPARAGRGGRLLRGRRGAHERREVRRPRPRRRGRRRDATASRRRGRRRRRRRRRPGRRAPGCAVSPTASRRSAGACAVTSPAAGGTRVEAWIPVEAPAAALDLPIGTPLGDRA